MADDMEEEIDLRKYILVLFKFKYWIVGLTIIAALAGLGGSFLIEPTYEAAALVAITKPRYNMQFDPRFSTDDFQPPYKAYLDLAMGDALIAQLVEDLKDGLDGQEQSVRAIRGMLEASPGSDPSIVRLIARNGDAERAALVANRWGELFVNHVNELYGQSQADLTFFDTQLAGARAVLAQTEQDLIIFQATNESAILQTQLDAKQAALQAYLDAALSLRLLIQDAQSLQHRLRAQDPTSPVLQNDELTMLLLAIDIQAKSDIPVELQVSGQQASTSKTVGEQLVLLADLIQSLQSKLKVVEQEAVALEPDILHLQEASERVKTEYDRLIVAKTVAQETVLTLSHKAAEARIAAQDEGGDARLASTAVTPDTPISPRKMTNVAIAGTCGLLVGVFGALAIAYWQEGESQAPSKPSARTEAS